MLYRKYRPQTIAELDNERIKSTLGKALLNNEWVHAYLLIGTRGSGKTTTARLIAKIVNCQNRKKGEEPCNKCESCQAISEAKSLDVIEVDAASNTGVEDIRELREKVKLAPTFSKYKVYIIDEVHMLSTSAFNALLKTLEEPPAHVLFVLATTDPQKLPATIVSRCLVYDFGRATETEIVSSLRRKAKLEKIEVDQKALEILAKRADGSFRDADKMLEQLSLEDSKITEEMAGTGQMKEACESILQNLAAGKTKPALEAVESYSRSGGQVRDLVHGLVDRLRLVLLSRNGVSSEAEEVSLSDSEVQELIEKFIDAGALAKDSPVVQLPLEMVIVSFKKESGKEEKKEKISSEGEKEETRLSVQELENQWNNILSAVKPHNHSLVALLRASRPKSLEGKFLNMEVFYKFHRDKLSETKNREILEGVISDIMGKEIKIKFELTEKR